MAIPMRPASTETQRPRNTLSLRTWRGQNCSKLTGGEQSDNNPEDIPAQLEAALYDARNRWDLARRQLPQDAEDWLKGGGFASPRKLDKLDAERLWSAFMAAMARESV